MEKHDGIPYMLDFEALSKMAAKIPMPCKRCGKDMNAAGVAEEFCLRTAIHSTLRHGENPKHIFTVLDFMRVMSSMEPSQANKEMAAAFDEKGGQELLNELVDRGIMAKIRHE